ncbi:MAG TPA: DUF3060 domain-containing protein [Acidimicrobiales bacterium]|nr:DUF3060 domain-containing protein [Acidimicrobiales bacterium]
MRRPLALLAAVALAVLAACGGDDGEGAADTIDSRDDAPASTEADPAEGEGDGEGAGDDGQADDDADDQDDDDSDEGSDEGSDDESGDGDGAVTLTSSGDHDCGGEDVAVRGTDLQVGLTGSCGVVTVGGNGNVVTVADAASVTIQGAGQNVEVTGSTDAISLTGAGHQVTYAGSPEVDDGSAGSTVG